MDEGKSNQAAVLHTKEDIRMEPVDTVEPGPDDVLLGMRSVGICGSDLKYWKYGVCGRFTVREPMVLGHEGSGVVIKAGSRVMNFKPGDRVAIEPGVPCRECNLCKSGRYNLCRYVKFCATPPVHGNIAKFFTHPADFCFKLPDNVSLDDGAMCEPLAVAVYSCERGGVTVGSQVLVCGAGPVGLLCMMVAKALGAASVIITDIDEHRLSIAKSLGAHHTMKVESRDHKVLAECIHNMLGHRPDMALECSGSDDSLSTAIYAVESGGSVVLVGRGTMTPTTPLVEAASREVDIKGVFRYANCYPKAISLLASGQVSTAALITHHFPFLDTEKAFQAAYSRDSKAIKVIIHCEQ